MTKVIICALCRLLTFIYGWIFFLVRGQETKMSMWSRPSAAIRDHNLLSSALCCLLIFLYIYFFFIGWRGRGEVECLGKTNLWVTMTMFTWTWKWSHWLCPCKCFCGNVWNHHFFICPGGVYIGIMSVPFCLVCPFKFIFIFLDCWVLFLCSSNVCWPVVLTLIIYVFVHLLNYLSPDIIYLLLFSFYWYIIYWLLYYGWPLGIGVLFVSSSQWREDVICLCFCCCVECLCLTYCVSFYF